MLPSTPTPPHFDEPRYTFTERMELSEDDHRALKVQSEELGMEFLSSPFSVEAVELLERVGVAAYKLASGEVTNPPLIEAIAATGKPVLVSSGMSGLEEIDGAVAILREHASPFVLLQCTSNYPCPPEKVNLQAMAVLAERYDCPVGLSDHTPDIYTSIAAVALGACCVEKHFTLSKRLYGPDHHASLDPADLKRLVDGAGIVHAAMGTRHKERDATLDPARATFEKSVVSVTEIPAGATIERSMLTTKRPGSGIPATRLRELVGRQAARDVAANVLLEDADLG
jgi:N-acetylneuraminate synthase